MMIHSPLFTLAESKAGKRNATHHQCLVSVRVSVPSVIYTSRDSHSPGGITDAATFQLLVLNKLFLRLFVCSRCLLLGFPEISVNMGDYISKSASSIHK